MFVFITSGVEVNYSLPNSIMAHGRRRRSARLTAEEVLHQIFDDDDDDSLCGSSRSEYVESDIEMDLSLRSRSSSNSSDDYTTIWCNA